MFGRQWFAQSCSSFTENQIKLLFTMLVKVLEILLAEKDENLNFIYDIWNYLTKHNN